MTGDRQRHIQHVTLGAPRVHANASVIIDFFFSVFGLQKVIDDTHTDTNESAFRHGC